MPNGGSREAQKSNNMKKFFSMMLIMASVVFVFSSCSEEKEEVGPDIPSTINLKVGEYYNLKHTAAWESSKTFVATVDGAGVITAKRAGKAEISAYNLSKKCYVNVVASYTLYDEPVTKWGISKSELKRLKGTPDNDTGTVYGYNCNSSYAPMEAYMFENNKLTSSAKLVKTTYTDQLVDHLMQRYMPLTVDTENYNIYFIDEETPNKANTVVGASLYKTSYWMVVYIPNPSNTRGNMDKEALFDSFRKEIESLCVIK